MLLTLDKDFGHIYIAVISQLLMNIRGLTPGMRDRRDEIDNIILTGALLRVVEDGELIVPPFKYLLITPLIYLLIFFMAVGSFYVSIVSADVVNLITYVYTPSPVWYGCF